jgi:lysophospholipase L1-like esterase
MSATPEATPALRAVKFLGCCDSITVGNDGTSYRDELSGLLRQAGVEPTFITTAVSGSPCLMWVAMIEDLIKANQPDVLLLNCGTNDAGYTVAQQKVFGEKYAAIINHARAAGVKIIVSKLQISRVDDRPQLAWLPGNEVKLNVVIEKAARFYGDVGLADFSAIPATVGNSTDGMHPNAAGELLYAKAWFSEGQRLGWW